MASDSRALDGPSKNQTGPVTRKPLYPPIFYTVAFSVANFLLWVLCFVFGTDPSYSLTPTEADDTNHPPLTHEKSLRKKSQLRESKHEIANLILEETFSWEEFGNLVNLIVSRVSDCTLDPLVTKPDIPELGPIVIMEAKKLIEEREASNSTQKVEDIQMVQKDELAAHGLTQSAISEPVLDDDLRFTNKCRLTTDRDTEFRVENNYDKLVASDHREETCELSSETVVEIPCMDETEDLAINILTKIY